MDLMEKNIEHLVNTYEDMQKVRMAEMSRARMLLYEKLVELGYLKPSDEEKPSFEDKELDKAIEKAKQDGKLSEVECEIIDDNTKYGKKFKTIEKALLDRIEPFVKNHIIYKEYLSHLKGIGIMTSARLIVRYGNCSRFDTISKMRMYSGFGVKDGEVQKKKRGQKLNFDPRCKTLGYLIADLAIKMNTKYRMLYDNEKNRLQTMYPEPVVIDGVKKFTKMHIHRRSMRKIVNVFLANYWKATRRIYGLPIRDPYPIAVLGHTTHYQPEEFFEQ